VDSLPQKLREMELAPRKRRPLRESVFQGQWGTPPEFADSEGSGPREG
jgi:hypothetical protein